MNDVSSFPEGRHRPGDPLFGIRDRRVNDFSDLPERRLYIFILLKDIVVNGQRLFAVVGLILTFK
jgi:hypothetical protein